ncbi:hypothetical protein SLOPH_1166, partial [Spraguea lophii 42_110]
NKQILFKKRINVECSSNFFFYFFYFFKEKSELKKHIKNKDISAINNILNHYIFQQIEFEERFDKLLYDSKNKNIKYKNIIINEDYDFLFQNEKISCGSSCFEI